MDAQEELLQRFARLIDLPAYLGQQGFRLSEHQEAGHLCMTRPTTGERLRLQKDVDRGGWTYGSAADPNDRGTVVDLITRRDGVTRDGCLNRLIACCDERVRSIPEAARYQDFRRAMPEDLARASRAHELGKLEELAASKALDRLGVTRGSLDEWRFGAVNRESDVAALTMEPDALWASRHRRSDNAVVLVERPIDAIGYDRVHGQQSACYLATGSNPNNEQLKRLGHILAEVPEGTRVVVAYGRDDAGRRLTEAVRSLVPMAKVERHSPEMGARWADQMQLERRHAMSLRRVGAALER